MIRVLALGAALLSSVSLASDSDSSRLRIDVPHHFSKADARARAQMLFEYWHVAFGVQSSWSGDKAEIAGKVMGIDIHAVLVVGDDRIGGDTNDPGPFMRGMAVGYITKKLQKYMHPQYVEP